MKITKRLALENYCYEELEFESLEEYEREYPKYVATFKRVRASLDPTRTQLTKEQEANLQ
jgi:hypothetical protein